MMSIVRHIGKERVGALLCRKIGEWYQKWYHFFDDREYIIYYTL